MNSDEPLHTPPPPRRKKRHKFVSLQGRAMEDPKVREAINFVTRFPLFTHSWPLKTGGRVHHSMFPHPLPTRLCHLPTRLTNFLNCLPILYIQPTNFGLVSSAAGVNAKKTGRKALLRRTNLSSAVFNVVASPKLVRDGIRYGYGEKEGFRHLPWVTDHFLRMGPEWREEVVNPSLYEEFRKENIKKLRRSCGYLQLNQDTGRLSSTGIAPVHGVTQNALRGYISVYRLDKKYWTDKMINAHLEDPFWTGHNLLCWHNQQLRMEERRAAYAHFDTLYLKHSWGSPWQFLALLYDEPVVDVKRGTWHADLLYAADPMSVFLYALTHGIIPPHLVGDDPGFDDRIFNLGPWDVYEEFRIKTMLEANRHLKILMPEFFPLGEEFMMDERFG